jgi:hypothetical protein
MFIQEKNQWLSDSSVELDKYLEGSIDFVKDM